MNYKRTAAYVAMIVRQNPERRVTVWDQNFEVVINTRLGVETNADYHKSEYNYIAKALCNARKEAQA